MLLTDRQTNNHTNTTTDVIDYITPLQRWQWE